MSEAGLGSQWGRFWRNSAPGQRIGVVAFALICVGVLALTATLARRPRFAVLYGGLEQQDAAEVVQRLRELKVPYRVTPAGTIEAPAEQVDEVRLDLASKGLPAGGQAGFELFDRAQFGLSDFGEKINYQRALEGELARTISHLESVVQARVHVAIPEERLYESEQAKPTASVVLQLRGGREPSPPEVRSVVHLVAGAVGGLAPESVTVLDTRGRLLSGRDGAEGAGGGVAAASTQMELRRAYEKQIEDAVQTMLDRVMGPSKAVVRASADISFERVETESETYQPASRPAGEAAAAETGVLQSRREVKENYRGTGEGRAAGVPGVSSNTGRGAALGGQSSALLPGAADEYQRDETADQYLVSRQVERRLQPPGQLQRLTLSVFVDEKADLGEAKDLRAAVAAAAGLKGKEAEAVVITRIPFQPAPEEGEGTKVSALRDFYFSVGRDLAAIVLMALFLRFVHGLLRRRAAGQPTAAPGRPGMEPVPAMAPAAQSPALRAAPTEGAFDPEKAASVVRRWISSEPAVAGAAAGGGDGGAGAAAGAPEE